MGKSLLFHHIHKGIATKNELYSECFLIPPCLELPQSIGRGQLKARREHRITKKARRLEYRLTDTYVCLIILGVELQGLSLLSYVFIELELRPEQQGNCSIISIYANQATYMH